MATCTNQQLAHLLDEDCLGCVVQVKVADLDGNSKEVLALVLSDGLYAFHGRSGQFLCALAAGRHR